MILWRLSGQRHAQAFDGGYGLHYDGRWNSAGQAVTYCSTSPALCVLEKLMHVQDPGLLPILVMVRYDIPDSLGMETVSVTELPASWQLQESWTQQRGDQWYSALRTPLLRVPSAIVSLDGSPNVNVLINHQHPAAAGITIAAAERFVMDVRLFQEPVGPELSNLRDSGETLIYAAFGAIAPRFADTAPPKITTAQAQTDTSM